MQLSKSGRAPGVRHFPPFLLSYPSRTSFPPQLPARALTPTFPSGAQQTKPRGFLATGALIVRRETPLALYKGLGAVLSGIVPKMAIRFASFERYKGWLADKETGVTSVGGIFVGEWLVRCSAVELACTSG